MTKSSNGSKQIFFAHSGGGQSGSGQGSFDFVSCLRKELSDKYEIHYPIIEDPEAPTYEMWKSLFSREFNKIENPVIFIGHSLGGSMLLKYLSEEKPNINISALFLVSTPLWGKNGWDVEDFVLKKDFELALKQISKVYLYHSKNDKIVPFEHLNFYRKAFPNALVRVLNGTEHAFPKGLPELVDDLKAIGKGP